MDSKIFDDLKTKVEKQIIVVLDFLMLDNQIESEEITNISNFVLNKLDKTTNSKDLYSSLFDLISQFKILNQYFQNTLKNLSQYSHAGN